MSARSRRSFHEADAPSRFSSGLLHQNSYAASHCAWRCLKSIPRIASDSSFFFAASVSFCIRCDMHGAVSSFPSFSAQYDAVSSCISARRFSPLPGPRFASVARSRRFLRAAAIQPSSAASSASASAPDSTPNATFSFAPPAALRCFRVSASSFCFAHRVHTAPSLCASIAHHWSCISSVSIFAVGVPPSTYLRLYRRPSSRGTARASSGLVEHPARQARDRLLLPSWPHHHTCISSMPAFSLVKLAPHPREAAAREAAPPGAERPGGAARGTLRLLRQPAPAVAHLAAPPTAPFVLRGASFTAFILSAAISVGSGAAPASFVPMIGTPAEAAPTARSAIREIAVIAHTCRSSARRAVT